MDNQEVLQRTLNRARRALQILEEEKAGYGIRVPVDLQIELEEKQKEITSLEGRLSQLQEKRPESVPDNLPRYHDVFVGRKQEITSRRRTGESALTIRLDRLLEAEALELMQAKGRSHPHLAQKLKATEPEILTALYQASGGNPLALDWTLGQVAHKGYSISVALERLRNAAKSADLYGFLFANAVQTLSANDRTVLSALAGFLTPAKTSALADATDLAITEIQISLEQLVTLSLVNDLDGERFGLHPLTRTYVRAAVDKTDIVGIVPLASGIRLDSAAQRKVLRYWVDFAQKYGGYDKDAYQTYDKLEAEWQNLEGVATTLREMAGIPGALKDREAAQMLIDLEKALYNFIWFRGYWDEGVRLGEWRYQLGKALGQWSDAGWGTYHVAWIHYNRAETDRAASWAAQMAEAMERGGSSRDKANVNCLQGQIAQQRQESVEAKRLYQEALVISRQLRKQNDQAIALNSLGIVAQSQKDYNRAESYFKQALAIEEKLGNKERQAIYCGNLGLIIFDRNRPMEARPWYERQLDLAHEVGRQDLVAGAKAGLAGVLEEEGRYLEGLRLALAALEIRERLRDQYLDWTRQLVERLQRKAGIE
ncbi:MAG: tetratricopeptide repeat protein [Nostoc sp.]|uniref:tetratricopeptide repeat protein n=1 Tax=Nostoc sp. TaxID=1180 RepID=UPI002FF991CC